MRAPLRPFSAVLAVAVLLVTGCAAGVRVFINPEADVSYYSKIATLQFADLTPNQYAGARLTQVFVTELVLANRYQIVDLAEFRMALDRIGGAPNSEGLIDPQKVRTAAEQVGARGILRGVVTEYGTQRFGSEDVPVLAFDVELIDVATGNVVWRASIAKRGKGRMPIVGGSGTRTFGRLTQEACAEMVSRLRKEGF